MRETTGLADPVRGMRRAGILSGILVLVLPSISALDDDRPAHVADFDYELGSAVAGQLSGSCAAAGVLFGRTDPAPLRLTSRGGVWEHFVTEVKYAVARPQAEDPFAQEVEKTQTRTALDVPAGEGVITWSPAGIVHAYASPGPLAAESGTFHAAFMAASLRTDPLTNRLATTSFFVQTPNGIVAQEGAIQGWNRVARLGPGELRISGNLTLYLEAAEADFGPTFRERMPPFREQVSATPDNPAAAYWIVRYHHAFLSLSDAQAVLPADRAPLVCQALDARVDGSLLAWKAVGTLHVAGETIRFARQELLLDGRFELHEAPTARDPEEPSTVRATGTGHFRRVNLDFGLPLDPGHDSWRVAKRIGLWATVSAGLSSLTYVGAKWLGPLFSRLREEQVEEHPARRRLLEALGANPGSTLTGLIRLLALDPSSTRYHLRILIQRGRIRTEKVAGHRRFWVRGGPVPDARALVVRYDPVVHRVLGFVPRDGTRMRDLLGSLHGELGISKPGAFKAVLRAERYGLVQRTREAQGVWVRCV